MKTLYSESRVLWQRKILDARNDDDFNDEDGNNGNNIKSVDVDDDDDVNDDDYCGSTIIQRSKKLADVENMDDLCEPKRKMGFNTTNVSDASVTSRTITMNNSDSDKEYDNTMNVTADNGLPWFTIFVFLGFMTMVIAGINATEGIIVIADDYNKDTMLWEVIWLSIVSLTSITLLIHAVKEACSGSRKIGSITNKCSCFMYVGMTFIFLPLLLTGIFFGFFFIGGGWNYGDHVWSCVSAWVVSILIPIVLWIVNKRTNIINFWRGYWVSHWIFISCNTFCYGFYFLLNYLVDEDGWLGPFVYAVIVCAGNAFIMLLILLLKVVKWRRTFDNNDESIIISNNSNNNNNNQVGIYCGDIYINLIGSALSYVFFYVAVNYFFITIGVLYMIVFVIVTLLTIKNIINNPNINVDRRSICTNNIKYPSDTYSFLALCDPRKETNLFCFGLLIFLFQSSLLIVMLLSVVVPKLRTTGEIDNPESGWLGNVFHSNSSELLQATQIISIIAYVFFPDASVSDVTEAVKLFPRFDRPDPKHQARGLAFSCSLKFLQGTLANLTVLLLVMTASDVIEIILNFTAVNFISILDDRAFELAEYNKYGLRMKMATDRIKNTDLPKCSSQNNKRLRFRYGMIVTTLLFVLLTVSVMFAQDSNDHWITETVRVQFEDNTLLSYSGCYDINEDSRSNKRYVYDSNSHNTAPATLAYCKRERRWLFFEGTDDPCDAWGTEKEISHSPKTDTFDVGSSITEDWFSAFNTPLDMYFIKDEETLQQNCGSFVHDGTCDVAVFNTFNYQYDGGDCCASTCSTGTSCGAVESSSIEKKYSDCVDPSMAAITIRFDQNYTSEDMNLIQDKLLKLDCTDEDTSYNAFTVQASAIRENDTEPVFVSVSSNCTLYIEGVEFNDTKVTSSLQYSVYHGYNLINGMNSFPIDVFQNRFYVPGQIFSTKNNTLSSTSLDTLLLSYSSTAIDLSMIGIHGTIPKEIASLTQLEYIDLSHNHFNGNFPFELLLLNNLKYLNLSGNEFTGSIPSEVGSLNELTSLNLYGNELTGSIPNEIFGLTELKTLDLGYEEEKEGYEAYYNYWKDDEIIKGLTGSISSEISMLTKMTSLRLSGSKLTGSIPSEIFALTELDELDLSGNALTGSIPSEMSKLTKLTSLSISDNKMTGSVPSEIGLLNELQILDFGSNGLTSSIPSEISMLQNLTSLDFSSNPLTGCIPSEILSLTKLTSLNLGTVRYVC